MADPAKSLDVDDQDGESDQSNKMLIVKILSEMHSTFNKDEPANALVNEEEKSLDNVPPKSPADDSSSVVFEAQPANEEEEEEDEDGEEGEEVEKRADENQIDNVSFADCPNLTMETAAVENTEGNPPDELLQSEALADEPPLLDVTVPNQSADINSMENETVEIQGNEVNEESKPVEIPDLTENAETPILSTPTEDHISSQENGSLEDDIKSSPPEEHDSLEENGDTLKRKSNVEEDAEKSDLSKPVPAEEPNEKRLRMSLRNSEKVEQDVALKRSSRRMSKDFNRESVLQNAIARKEKSLCSFSPEDKPRRSSRLSDESKAYCQQRVVKPKYRAKTADPPVEESYSHMNGSDSVPSSPIRCGKPQYEGDVEDTSSDWSSASVKKTRRLEQASKNYKLTKDNFALDEDSGSSWQAQSNFDSPDKGKGKRKPLVSVNVAEACEPPNLRSNKADLPPTSVSEQISWAGDALLCECESMTAMFPKTEPNQLCRALDVYENRIVKCANLIDDFPLLRPCKTKPFQALCSLHFERMVRHNCCPTCGTYCTQGIVNICENKHLFHKDCDLKLDESLVCPHCGSNSYTLYKIQLANHQYPLFLPSTKPLNKLPVARMSFFRKVSKKADKIEGELTEVLPSCNLTLPSGRTITTVGISLPEREKLEYLLQRFGENNDIRYTYRNFYQAAKNGDAEKVLALLSAGMSPNQCTMNPLMGAVREGHLLVTHLLVQGGANLETLDKNQFTPLMLAVQYKHNSLVKYLVKAGASVGFKGADGMTALHIAAKEGNLEACHYILTLANLPPAFINTVDDGRWTALVWAAENCHTKIVRYLLEKRADPQIRDAEMNNALHWSAFSGSMETTEDLLNYGCSVNLANTHGDTPLHIAARQAADNCVVLLLARGANVDVVNKAGQLPRDCVVNKDSYCYTAIELNTIIKKSVANCSLFPRILCNDVSGGREDNPIQCVNAIDDEEMPTDYTYVTENCFTSNITIDRRISSLMSCKCEDNCCSPGCTCVKISRGCWYDNMGKLIPEFNFEDPPMLFECNPACGCNVLTCKNRVVQKGLKSRLQLCKTKDKSWGVITLKEIPKGSYVCEYIGEIISDLEADTREDDSYLFDLDNAESETYCLDARRYGNICRFINHSCRPNLSPVKIYFQHQDLHFPRIAMFASRDIASNEELGFDYGEKFWIIKCKSFTCHCGEPTCRYSESTIQHTLDKYQQKLRELEEASDFAVS